MLLVAPPSLAALIAGDLRETGVGAVHLRTPAEMAGAPVRSPCVAAVFDDPADDDVLPAAVAACRDHGLPVLRFGVTAESAEVGPAFCGIETACVPCFRKGRDTEPAAKPWTAPDATAGMLASLVTSALLGLLTRQPPVPAPRTLTRISAHSHNSERFEVLPDLECECCGGGTPPRDPAARKALEYEWLMAKPPPLFEPANVTTPAERDRLTALLRQRVAFPAAPRHRLPDEPAIPGPDGRDESVLAAILARTAGYRTAGDPDSPRWAPTGGNMASVGVYLCTGTGLFGLPGTIYRYDDMTHEVLSVHADQVALPQFLDGTDLDSSRTDIAIALIGEAGRLGLKYGEFAWRLTHLDSGCAALQLHLVASGYGLRATFASRWPARLAEILELDPDREAVTVLAGLSAAAGPPREGS